MSSLCVMLIVCLICIAQLGEAKNVQITLSAKWKETPLLAETCELVERHRPGSFFSCLDIVSAEMKRNSTLPNLLVTSQRAQTILFDTIVSQLLPPTSLRLARIELTTRVYSPAVEAHRTLSVRALEHVSAAPCRSSPSFAVVDDQTFLCSPLELKTFLANADESHKDDSKEAAAVFKGLDHVLVRAKVQSSATHSAVLYGVIGEQTTDEFHRMLSAAQQYKYTFRHGHVVVSDAQLASRWDVPLAVQGYGATLDVKNIEYKAVDEKKAKGAAASEKSSSDEATPLADDDAVVAGFDIAKLKQRKPHLAVQLSQLAEALAARSASTAQKRPPVQVDLQVWELQSLGYQAALNVLKSAKPLETLSDFLTNFPLRAGRVSQMTASYKSLSQQLTSLQRMFGDGSNAIFLNGRMIPEERADLFSLLHEIREEQLLHDSVHNALFYNPTTDESVTKFSDPDETYRLVARVRQCQLQQPGVRRNDKTKRFYLQASSVSWLNDLSTDPFWEAAGSSVRELLQMNYYGQPRFPKKNIFHLVYLVDPATKEGLEAAVTLLRLLEQGVAVRMGLALVDSGYKPLASITDEAQITPSIAASAVFHRISSEPDQGPKALRFLAALLTAVKAKPLTTEFIAKIAEEDYQVPTVSGSARSDEFLTQYNSLNRYVRSVGIRTFPVGLFNGLLFRDNLESVLYQAFNGEYMIVREMVVKSELTDDVQDIFEFIHEKQNAIRRYQGAIFDHTTYVPFRKPTAARLMTNRPALVSPANSGEIALLTHIMLLPHPLTMDGLFAFRTMAEHLIECNASCVGVRSLTLQCLPQPGQKLHGLELFLEQLQYYGNAHLTSSKRASFVRDIVGSIMTRLEEELADVKKTNGDQQSEEALNLSDPALAERVLEHLLSSSTVDHAVIAAIRKTHIPPSAAHTASAFCADLAEADSDFASISTAPTLYTNGRKVTVDTTFLSSDFSLLEQEEASRASAAWVCIEFFDYVGLTDKAIPSDDITSDFQSTKLFILGSILSTDFVTRGARTERIYLPYLETPYSFKASPKSERPAQFALTMVINPVSREAQEYVELAKYFLASLDVSVVIFLNPPAELQKLPVKNFYQFVGDVELAFDDHGMIRPPMAYFRHMPDDVLLTMGLNEPEAWMVFAKSADQDLDNIKLSLLPKRKHTLEAHYELQSILLTGSAWDRTTEGHPKALPLVINTRQGSQLREEGARDTLVMANFGYLQLQGNPGVWYLSIQNGVPADIYEILSVEEKENKNVYFTPRSRSNGGMLQPLAERSRPVVMTSFNGKHVHVQVKKQEGKENLNFLDVLSSQQEEVWQDGGIVSSASSWPPEGHRESRPERPTLNIFSVASGHLYERFMRMMFHTVMQTSSNIHGENTTRIKFWIIENFLSPGFKEFVPKMAAKYGFDYGFVTYRWPYWLRRQTEKQRIIWAYKILFLDVLFPLDVERVIFVDSDQIVFADLHELYNMDLKGKAVAYTPFCRGGNRNEDTTGFRFWDQGYWVDHLQGKPYHISAIYVVDLKRLRRIAGGDTYRMIYDQLSADPNSLANLDQDLPNFAQHQVPIHSLPEEWLWCETWCNQDSKKRAKTIDLCNNPLTKTPKLENAKRIIPNWEEMDNTLDALEKELMAN